MCIRDSHYIWSSPLKPFLHVPFQESQVFPYIKRPSQSTGIAECVTLQRQSSSSKIPLTFVLNTSEMKSSIINDPVFFIVLFILHCNVQSLFLSSPCLLFLSRALFPLSVKQTHTHWRKHFHFLSWYFCYTSYFSFFFHLCFLLTPLHVISISSLHFPVIYLYFVW